MTVPSSMNYQGILRDGDGNLISSGEYDLTFRIYATIGSTEHLFEQSQIGVIVRDGRFSTTLSNIPPTVFTKGKDDDDDTGKSKPGCLGFMAALLP